MSDFQYQPAYVEPTIPPVQPEIKKIESNKNPFKKVYLFFAERLATAKAGSSSNNSNTAVNSGISIRKAKKFLKRSLLLPVVVLAVFVLIVSYMIVNSFSNNKPATVLSSDGKVEIQKPKAQQQLSKLFLFPLKDAKGKEVSKLKYQIENAELRDEIIVKGQRATSVKDRTFLIINLKITNDFNQTVTLNTRDYVRLTVNNKDEKLAPDIHNDPVEIQPISTKYTRLGFPINESDKNLTLQIGEINGKKEAIKLNLK